MKVSIDDVKIREERFREDYGEVEELAVSIQRYGLFHPIVVDDQLNLIAGERRLKAHRMLGLKEIEVRKVTDITELERREIEVEENLRRKNFTWQEEVKALREVDRIKREMYGHAIPGHGGGWSIRDTADSLGSSIGKVSQDIKLANMLEEYPELSQEPTKDAARKKYERMRESRVVSALAEKVKVEVGTECIVNGDSATVMKGLAAESVDLVFTDPPFGIALDKGMKSKEAWNDKVYDDDTQHVLNTIQLVLKECYRVLKDGRHMYLWFGIQHYDYIFKMLEDIGFNVNKVPCVWTKRGGAGVGGSDFSYSSNYEVCFFCMKGRRSLNKLGQPNVWEEQRVAPQRKIHPTEKPTSLIRRCVEQSSQAGELVIDPFAGSGSTLIGALECNRQAWGCELDKEYYGKIVIRLEEMQRKGVVKEEVVEEEVPVEAEEV
jgi:DNA modification methylase